MHLWPLGGEFGYFRNWAFKHRTRLGKPLPSVCIRLARRLGYVEVGSEASLSRAHTLKPGITVSGFGLMGYRFSFCQNPRLSLQHV